jgi:selenocysteine lyase/cysteine desulfurase
MQNLSSLSPTQFRARFPIFERCVYLNSCSQGALAVDVEAALREYTDSWHESGSPWELWVDKVDQLRAAFAASIGADHDEVAVMPSASAGINAIASALNFGGVRSHVVMGEFEFPTMVHVWLAQQWRGATIRWARASGDRLDTDAYERVVDERTLIVPATHVCFRNGHKTDIAALTRLCHARGAYVCLDDYQRTGSGPIDVRSLGVDFMVTGCLKYLLAAAGVALLYVRRDLIERLEPTITGWFGRIDPFAFRIDELDWSSTASRFESGTPPVPSVYAALGALRLLDQVGLDVVERQIGHLVETYRRALQARGFLVRTPAEPERRGPLVVVQSVNAAVLVSRLAERGVICSCRGNGLRASFHAYNDESDVDAIVTALDSESALLDRTVAPAV